MSAGSGASRREPRPVPGMGEREAPGVQEGTRQASTGAVEAVPGDREPELGEMHAHLVRSSGQRPRENEREAVGRREPHVPRSVPIYRNGPCEIDPARAGRGRSRARSRAGQAQGLPRRPRGTSSRRAGAPRFRQRPSGLVVAREHQEAAGDPVEAVKEEEVRAMPVPPRELYASASGAVSSSGRRCRGGCDARPGGLLTARSQPSSWTISRAAGSESGVFSVSASGITSMTSPVCTVRDSTRTETLLSQRRPPSMSARTRRLGRPVNVAVTLSSRSPLGPAADEVADDPGTRVSQ